MKKLIIYTLSVFVLISVPIFSASAEPSLSTSEEKIKLIQESMVLFDKNDCKSCHKIESKLTGPSYQDVANKYFPKIKEGIITTLAEKVIKGGNRNWGFAMMTAHPNLSPEDAQKMVAAVLLLADPEVPQDQKLKLPD